MTHTHPAANRNSFRLHSSGMRLRAVLFDVLGLAFLLFVLLDYLRPSLLLLPTIAAGGDTPCHYPTLVYFYERLLPHGRAHGWYPGAYLGHPLLLYYFPLPFLAMSALVPMVGLPVAFKLGSVLGVFLLPALTFTAFRLMGLRSPGPLLGAGAAVFFLFLEENPIWGGTLASTLTGEFAYSYGIGLAILFLGAVEWARRRNAGPWLPGAILGVTALAHGYAVLWAGLSATFLLCGSRRPLRSVAWLALVAGFAFSLAAFWLLPLVADWGWTTPFNDPWITVKIAQLVPPYLWPLVGCILLGLVLPRCGTRKSRLPDHRILFFLHAAAMAAALAAAGPALGVIDVRFVPFAQLALCLAGAVSLSLVLEEMAAPRMAALGLVLALALYGDGQSRVLRSWIDWNFTGLEAKELWPAFRTLCRHLKGGVADPRVAVEYATEHEKAGSIRVYETLPLFSGRSTLEGVYNQASLMTHPVYYLSSELGERSPNPFRNRAYSRFDTDGAIRHLRMLNVRDVVAVSAMLKAALDARSDLERVLEAPPYSVFRLKDAQAGYVTPLAFAPVRVSPRGWRERSYFWFSFKPQSPVHLVFTDTDRFGVRWDDPYLPPPVRPLPDDVRVEEKVEAERITVDTNRPGHPLLVKVSFHPRWRATGADGPYLVSPGLMLIVPRERRTVLEYSSGPLDTAGVLLSLGAVGWGGLITWRRGRKRNAFGLAPDAATSIPPSDRGRRLGGAIPFAVVMALVALRLAARPMDRSVQVRELSERALSADAAGQHDQAAELLRHALLSGGTGDRVDELRVRRGESLLSGGHAQQAIAELESVAGAGLHGPFVPQALFGLAKARSTAGDSAGADAARKRLLEEFPSTPWAAKARAAIE